MKTQKISFGLPKINFTGIKFNKPLANLNEPIQDTFVKSQNNENKNEKDTETIVAGMKDSKGEARFTQAEVNDFKISNATKAIDFNTVNAFKDTTDFQMSDMKKVYKMGEDLKDKTFNEKVIKAIAILPKGVKPEEFEQNKFEPKKEFSLICGNNSYKFNAQNGNLISKTTTKVDMYSDVLQTKTVDYVNNTVTTKERKYDYDKKSYELLSQTVTKNDKNGNMLRKETMTPSEIKGVFDVKYTYANGKTKQVAKATVDKKTGIQTVKKDMKSDNGTRTQFLYEDDPQGNRILDYKVTNKDGKILMGLSQSFEVVDENHFISSKNGYKYDITTDENKLTVKDLHHNTETSIDFKKRCKGDKKELINLLKKVPGEELFETVDSLKKMTGKKDVLESYFNPITKNINIGDDLFVFLHELGHAKDAQFQKGLMNKVIGDGRLYTNNEDIQKTFFKERETFNKYHSEDEREHISYFTQAKGHYQGELGGLAEVVAETNAVTNTFTDGKVDCLGPRAQYLQQYFPETIAKIRDNMNWKDDIAAIEYYGT